ncbi:hypothetical protein EVJ27_07505 [Exiguobacterium sp. SH3S2]|nr:hypothetical protein EVJ28_07505 [Exiguobacterium sp. SH3S3]TCI56762.1 hypothetical protein EVJ30_04165 [Exiguobacterium sp. SH5S13]TCI60999.1 hypothetical protein EVJ27_07505 [Exiguobacterium sp. SH3S2]
MGGCETSELVAEDIAQVRIAESVDFGRFQERAVVTYDRLEDVKVFADMIRNADEQPGIVNMATPEYDVEVRYTSDKTDRYYVWIGEFGKPTSLMNVNDTNTVYLVPADVTDELIELLETD